MFAYLLKARKKDIYQLPPPAVLLDWQVDWADYGGHQEDGGWNPEGAGSGRKAFLFLRCACFYLQICLCRSWGKLCDVHGCVCVFGQLLMGTECSPMCFRLCILCCQAGNGSVSTSDVCRMSALTTSVFMAPHPLHKVPFRALLPLVGWKSKLSLSHSITCLALFHF